MQVKLIANGWTKAERVLKWWKVILLTWLLTRKFLWCFEFGSHYEILFVHWNFSECFLCTFVHNRVTHFKLCLMNWAALWTPEATSLHFLRTHLEPCQLRWSWNSSSHQYLLLSLEGNIIKVSLFVITSFYYMSWCHTHRTWIIAYWTMEHRTNRWLCKEAWFPW